MNSIAEALVRAVGLLQGFTAQKAADGEFSDIEIEQMKGELEALIDAIDYELDLRQTALQSASEQRQRRQEV